MEALEILGPIIELIYMLIVESNRVPDEENISLILESNRVAGEENISYGKPIELAYGFSRKICVTI